MLCVSSPSSLEDSELQRQTWREKGEEGTGDRAISIVQRRREQKLAGMQGDR